MRHAYLILAHHEYEILQLLIDALDDVRNDIYIHIDRKVRELPRLTSKASKLIYTEKRVDIRWGHFSQIEAEMVLFNMVKNCDYSYCHLISGVHLPLYGQDYLHQFYANLDGKQVLYALPSHEQEAWMKVRRRSFFTAYYAHVNPFISRLAQRSWSLLLRLQRMMGTMRNQYHFYEKASNWISLTQEAVDFLVSEEKVVRKKFRNTFCGDEFFVPTVLANAQRKWEIHFEKRLLFQRMDQGKATVLSDGCFEELMKSEALFARKFSCSEMNIVYRVMNELKERN